MARPHIESIHAYDVEPEEVRVGILAGTRRRMLSEDDRDGSYTALVSFPAGWRGTLGGARPVELLTLTGAGSFAGTDFEAGMWAWVPTNAAAELELAEAGDALVMVEPVREVPGEVEIVDCVERRYAEGHSVHGVPHGLARKILRRDPDVGDRTWLAGVPPGWLGFRGEIHPTVEEALLIRGDCLLDNSGGMVAGDYFWRPGGIHHGPFATRSGFLYFFRTKGGDMAVEWDDPDDWDVRARAYYDAQPWFAPAG
jgi:hypothetical protein